MSEFEVKKMIAEWKKEWDDIPGEIKQTVDNSCSRTLICSEFETILTPDFFN